MLPFIIQLPPQAKILGKDRNSVRFSRLTPPVGINLTCGKAAESIALPLSAAKPHRANRSLPLVSALAQIDLFVRSDILRADAKYLNARVSRSHTVAVGIAYARTLKSR